MSNFDLPLTELSSGLIEGVPYSSNLSKYTGYAYGGPTLRTSGNFKELHKWEYEYQRETSTLKIWREDLPDEAFVVFDDIPDIYEISVCLDKTMNVVATYVIREGSFLRFYDFRATGYESLLLEEASTPKVALSSVYDYHATRSEIVVGYIKPSTHELCLRLERDRFTKEVILKKFDKKAKLVNISFADTNRFQYEVLEAL